MSHLSWHMVLTREVNGVWCGHGKAHTTPQGSPHRHDKRKVSSMEIEIPALDSFYGQDTNRAPVEYQKEKPIHRRILFLKAHGMSNVDIAEQLSMTPVGVGLVCRQEWFKKALVQLMNGAGVDAVKTAITGAALDSVFKVISLRDSATSEAVQRDCAFDLLDRYLGKAPQPLAAEKQPIADEARLDAEILELQRKIGRN